MSHDWIIRCSNRRCKHVCRESEWVPHMDSKTVRGMRVTKLICPKCGCESFIKATEKDLEDSKDREPVQLITGDWAGTFRDSRAMPKNEAEKAKARIETQMGADGFALIAPLGA